MGTSFDLSVCICTYKRPDLLAGLLQRLQELHEIEQIAEIVIVDNDPARSASAVIEKWEQQSRIPVVALHVPTPNISLARNAAIHAAKGEWIGLIDDDELPDHAWIRELLKAQRDFDADVIHGPVLPIYPSNTPAWIQEGGFFSRPRHATGTPLEARDLRAGNALARRSTLLQIPGPFDPAFGRTGGEDTFLFKQLLARGISMVWSDEAIVHEMLLPERTTMAWLAKRSFQVGHIWARTGRIQKNWRTVAHAIRRIGIDSTLFIALLAFSRVGAVRRLRSAARFAGTLYAFMELRYEAYGH